MDIDITGSIVILDEAHGVESAIWMFADQSKKRGRILRKSQEQGEHLARRNPTAEAAMSSAQLEEAVNLDIFFSLVLAKILYP